MGLAGVPRPRWLGATMTTTMCHYVLCVVFLLMVFFMYRIVNSPFDLTIHGVRQSRRRMNALGFNVSLHKQMTYVMSGMMAGVGGIMFVMHTGFISPNETTTLMTSKAFLMALVGGTGTITGALIGATIIVLMQNIVSSMTERWLLIVGLLYIFTGMVSPKGVMGVARSLKLKYLNKKERESAAKEHALSVTDDE